LTAGSGDVRETSHLFRQSLSIYAIGSFISADEKPELYNLPTFGSSFF